MRAPSHRLHIRYKRETSSALTVSYTLRTKMAVLLCVLWDACLWQSSEGTFCYIFCTKWAVLQCALRDASLGQSAVRTVSYSIRTKMVVLHCVLWVTSSRSVQRDCKENNTTTVTLRVVGGDGEGSLKSETVKYGHKSQGTWTLERLHWQGPAAHTKERNDLSSERVPRKNKTVTVTQVIKIWSLALDGCFIPRHTGRLTVGRNIRLRLRAN
jgi:hypothetical protein